MILDYYKTHYNKVSTAVQRSAKAAVLCLLSTGKRPSEIRQMSLSHYVKHQDRFIFYLPKHTKTSRPGWIEDRTIAIKWFLPGNEAICPYITLEEYIEWTQKTRQTEVLFVTTTTGNPIAGQTLARWTRNAMEDSGIDTTVFTPHSVLSSNFISSKTNPELGICVKNGKLAENSHLLHPLLM